jgi:hypothetical protein
MFKLSFGDQILNVKKIVPSSFSEYHKKVISSMSLINSNLQFSDKKWKSIHLGAGEEKAVYCVCDNNNQVFALELIDEKHYLNGRLVDGDYFYSTRIQSIRNIKFNKNSVIGLTFTGLVKVREYIYGYEWGHFQLSAYRAHFLDNILTTYLQTFLMSQFHKYDMRYKDVHDRNIMFELRNHKDNGIPILARDIDNKIKLYKIGLRPIDVR